MKKSWRNYSDRNRRKRNKGEAVDEVAARQFKEAKEREVGQLNLEIRLLNARLPELDRELDELKRKLEEAIEKVKTLGDDLELYKKGKKIVKPYEERNKEQAEEKTNEPDIDAGEVVPSKGNDQTPTGGTGTQTDQTDKADKKDEPNQNDKGNDKGIPTTDDPDLLPINDGEIIDIFDRREFILILNVELTMKNYSESGYSKNPSGWYYNPNTDEYDENYDPLKDPLFQMFAYYEVVQALDVKATLGEYSASGYSKNTFGWYYDPNKDEYEEDYDPLKDPLFQVFVSRKRYIGVGLLGQIPTVTKGKDGEDKVPTGDDKVPTGDDKKIPEKDPKKKGEEEKEIITHKVTLNITGPDGKQTTVVVTVEDGRPLFELDENKKMKDTEASRIFNNVCREVFGPKGHYRIKEIATDIENFKLFETAIKDDMEMDVTVGRYYNVTFNNGDNSYGTVEIEEGRYLDPNLIERIDRAVNFGYSDIKKVPYVGKLENKRDVNFIKKAFTGLKYWGIAGTENDNDRPEKFKFDQPITDDYVLEAQTGIKGKTVAATTLGLATGAAIDLIGGPLAGRIAMAAATGAERVTKFKLNHHKEMIGYEEINRMTGIKKANAKLKNYFRKTQNIQNLQYFFRSIVVGAGLTELGRFAVDKFTPTPTPDEPIPGEDLHLKPIDPTPKETPVFKGLEPNNPIYTDTQGLHANGKPWMRWFDQELHYYDVGTGKEIIPGQTPFSEVAGKLFKVVETQPDGSLVDMGVQRATEALEVVEKVGGMTR